MVKINQSLARPIHEPMTNRSPTANWWMMLLSDRHRTHPSPQPHGMPWLMLGNG
jgi:hypothetical protein